MKRPVPVVRWVRVLEGVKSRYFGCCLTVFCTSELRCLKPVLIGMCQAVEKGEWRFMVNARVVKNV